MSKGIFLLLDQNKDEIFENHQALKYSIEAFQDTFDDFSYLKRIMNCCHPHLKSISDQGTRNKPVFHVNHTIYTFINEYIRWIQDELLQNRSYLDRDKIKYVIFNLPPLSWATAITKVEAMLAQIYANDLHPLPFPNSLTLTPDLSLTLLDFIPQSERAELECGTGEMTIPATINQIDNPYQKRNKGKHLCEKQTQ